MKDGQGLGPFVVSPMVSPARDKEPGRAAFRPTGLAAAPDGALFVSDDVHGRIWRVTYRGPAAAA